MRDEGACSARHGRSGRAACAATSPAGLSAWAAPVVANARLSKTADLSRGHDDGATSEYLSDVIIICPAALPRCQT